MGWKVTQEPVVEPVTLEEAKKNLRVQHSAEDDLIEQYIRAARDYCEQELGLAIIEQEITYFSYSMPTGSYIDLPRPNVLSVTSINYIDNDEVSTPFTDYYVDLYSDFGRITPNDSWPSGSRVTIVYRAGFKEYDALDTQLCPPTVKQAMLLLINHFYENRTAVLVGVTSSQLQIAVESLLMKYRRLGI